MTYYNLLLYIIQYQTYVLELNEIFNYLVKFLVRGYIEANWSLNPNVLPYKYQTSKSDKENSLQEE